jgi:hypothetical protein
MNQRITPATPDEKIVHQAKAWRCVDKDAIGDKQDRRKQQAEWHERQKLRKVIDEAKEAP